MKEEPDFVEPRSFEELANIFRTLFKPCTDLVEVEDEEVEQGDPIPLTMEEQDMEDQMERDKHK